ncbi:MAG: HD domain-containing protein [Actinobacteria bacterium]|nr:HD domain-containing protein [Actinomycetota bacterium]
MMKQMLSVAEKLNPGPWVKHSYFTGKAAANIGKALNLNPERCYILGCLHDIGRRFGKTLIKHVIDGYTFLETLGFPAAARICITHSFPYKDITSYSGIIDCSIEESSFIKDYLNGIVYNDYDKLIQLCDTIAWSSGFCLMEKRMIAVVMRHGITNTTMKKWEAFFKIKNEFEQRIGVTIYKLLPGVTKTTFL